MPSGSRSAAPSLQAAEKHGYVQSQGIDHQKLIGWTLKSSALRWTLTPDIPDSAKSANQFFRELYLAVAEILTERPHPLLISSRTSIRPRSMPIGARRSSSGSGATSAT